MMRTVYGFLCGLALMGALMGCGDDGETSDPECSTFNEKLRFESEEKLDPPSVKWSFRGSS